MSPRVKAPTNPFAGTGPNTRAFREQARRWLTFIGQRGGLATSPRKRAASIISLKAARAARAAKAERLKQGADRHEQGDTDGRAR